MEGNKIQFVRSNVLFENNPGLSFLSLSNNDIEFITANAFKNQSNLEVLVLDWNYRLTNRENEVFLQSTSLRYLSCRHCSFVRLDNMTLAGLPNLTNLTLEHNFIATLDPNALQQTTKLRYLNLRHNHLVAFEPNINQLDQLKVLCLAGSPMFDLDHPKNQALLEGLQRMMELDKDCQDTTFSNKLRERYDLRNKDKNDEAKDLYVLSDSSDIEVYDQSPEHHLSTDGSTVDGRTDFHDTTFSNKLSEPNDIRSKAKNESVEYGAGVSVGWLYAAMAELIVIAIVSICYILRHKINSAKNSQTQVKTNQHKDNQS